MKGIGPMTPPFDPTDDDLTPWAPDAADVPRLLEEASAKARREKGGA